MHTGHNAHPHTYMYTHYLHTLAHNHTWCGRSNRERNSTVDVRDKYRDAKAGRCESSENIEMEGACREITNRVNRDSKRGIEERWKRDSKSNADSKWWNERAYKWRGVATTFNLDNKQHSHLMVIILSPSRPILTHSHSWNCLITSSFSKFISITIILW